MTQRYTAAGVFRRTPQQRADQELSWNRSDQAFFAAVPNDLASFCADHWHRMHEQFHQDPRPRARSYLDRFPPSPDA